MKPAGKATVAAPAEADRTIAAPVEEGGGDGDVDTGRGGWDGGGDTDRREQNVGGETVTQSYE